MRLQLLLPAAGLIILCTTQASAAPLVVSCAPGQHAVVRDAFVRGQAVTRVECAGNATNGRTYRTRYVTAERPRRHRSVAKSALIIGGSAASGAGIGGIVHGKKGALIGAAIGGGAASLFEGARRR